ncbi:hypothetical protein [Paradesulfitobacterium ferrireducens]|uniref:hypothetical protein n=1 Tax=Paradesulfitobacterium ferrireducens TaxID=2816476 RepID=UPI001A90A150|nr:hypothetical protein [Paradesulfitobacterium ferrireducens]
MDNFFDETVEKVYQWVGRSLSSCPVRDGVVFYHGSDKIFKLVERRFGWHLQFCVPVPESPGLRILSPEEAKVKKLGKSRWIFRGDSDRDAENLIKAALDSLPTRHVIEPALTRDLPTLCEATCPCFKKMERIVNNKSLPSELTEPLQEAYDLLQQGKYAEFVLRLETVIEQVIDYLLGQQGIARDNRNLQDKIKILTDRKVISKNLKEEVDVIILRRNYKYDYTVEERAYPMALMMVALMSRLLKVCA